MAEEINEAPEKGQVENTQENQQVETQTEVQDPQPADNQQPEINKDEIFSSVFQERFGVDPEQAKQRMEMAQQFEWLQEDPYAQKMIDYYRNTGDISTFANKVGRNWDEVSDMDILFEGYQQRYPDQDKDTINQIIKRKHAALFSEDDDEVDPLDLAESKREIRELRNKFKKEAEEFGKPKNHLAEEEQKYMEMLKQYQQAIDSSQEIQEFRKNKKITFNESGLEQNFEVKDTDKVVELLKDPPAIWSLIEGQPRDKQLEYAAFLSDPEGFKAQLIELGKNSAKISTEEEQREAAPPSTQPQTPPSNVKIDPSLPFEQWPDDWKKAFKEGAKVVKR